MKKKGYVINWNEELGKMERGELGDAPRHIHNEDEPTFFHPKRKSEAQIQAGLAKVRAERAEVDRQWRLKEEAQRARETEFCDWKMEIGKCEETDIPLNQNPVDWTDTFGDVSFLIGLPVVLALLMGVAWIITGGK